MSAQKRLIRANGDVSRETESVSLLLEFRCLDVTVNIGIPFPDSNEICTNVFSVHYRCLGSLSLGKLFEVSRVEKLHSIILIDNLKWIFSRTQQLEIRLQQP